MKTRIKICGLTREEDLQLCIKNNVDFAGFIFHRPSSRGLTPERAGSMQGMEGGRVGVFVRQSPQEIIQAARLARLDFIQLHGGQDPEFCAELPREKLIKVFWPEKCASSEELRKEMQGFIHLTRFFLVDAGSGGGGHGRTIESPFLREILEEKETFIAGGLGPENVRQAIDLGPFGVDLSSGVEKNPGKKDPGLVAELVQQAENSEKQGN